MSLFGAMDAADVSDNPFYVAPGIYSCILTEIVLRNTQAGGYGLSFGWTIEDDSEYNGQTLSDWITVYFDDDDANDSNALRRDRATLKRVLSSIGLSIEQMNELATDGELNEEIAGEYLGTSAILEVVESRSKKDADKVYTNIKSIRRPDAA